MNRPMHAGPLFRDLIVEIVKAKSARNYLEIGVRDGSTLALVDCDAIGVDPAFQLSAYPVGRKKSLHLYQMTSDAFFRDYNPNQILGGHIDITFIDGLHKIEFALRDFINSERVSGPNSVIIIDDCLPINDEMTERHHRPEMRTDKEHAGWWTGDVWKIIPILRKYRPDLKLVAFDTSPTGLICVTNLNPNSPTLFEQYTKMIGDVHTQRYDIEEMYSEIEIVSTRDVLATSDLSLFVGP